MFPKVIPKTIFVDELLAILLSHKGKYSPETRGRIKRVRYGLDKEEI
jgi:hypothetical protein